MYRYLLALLVLGVVLVADHAHALKTVLTYQYVLYHCWDEQLAVCSEQRREEDYTEVEDFAELVDVQRTESVNTSVYPYVKEVRTYYYWTECSTGGCPTPESEKGELK